MYTKFCECAKHFTYITMMTSFARKMWQVQAYSPSISNRLDRKKNTQSPIVQLFPNILALGSTLYNNTVKTLPPFQGLEKTVSLCQLLKPLF